MIFTPIQLMAELLRDYKYSSKMESPAESALIKEICRCPRDSVPNGTLNLRIEHPENLM